jgi:hypothetical protein
MDKGTDDELGQTDLSEVQCAFIFGNNIEACGIDNLNVELFKYGPHSLIKRLLHFILCVGNKTEYHQNGQQQL